MSGRSSVTGTLLLHERVARQAAASPEAVAVSDDERDLSYAELDDRANRLAEALRARGAGAGALVGVCLHRSVDLVIALLAVWKAGAAYVPFDPDHPQHRLAELFRDTGIAVVLTEEAAVAKVREAGAEPLLLGGETKTDLGAVTGPLEPVTGEHPAYVVFTSGSTGRPKGVVISHAGIANRVDWAVTTHGLSQADRVLQKTALTFDAACWEVFAPLVSGGTVVMAPVGAERDVALMVQAVAKNDITVLQVVPSVLRLLVEESGWEACTSLRLLFCAGEQLRAELVHRFLELVPGEVQVWNTYGPTECSIDVTAFRFDPAQEWGPVPIGRPIPGMRVLVADADGRPVPVGSYGELCAGGVGVAHGYLNRPGQTAAVFVPDAYGPPGSRLYRTGDRVRWRRDGTLEYLGRLDGQLKINGVRIEPAEIEAALLAHHGVHAAVVTSFAAPDGETRMAGYVQAHNPDIAAELPAFLADRLPVTHVPSAFVALKAFPVTTNGKVDRAALPAPTLSTSVVGVSVSLTDDEKLVAGLWQELLGAEAVGPDDDFFRLGGTSLQFTRLANRLRKATGRSLELSKLLSATTVTAQARLISNGPAEDAPIRRVPRTGGLPLSFGQRRLYVLDRLNPGSREWVTGPFLRIPGSVPVEIVQQALDTLVVRHESLRTRFVVRDGEPQQVIDRPAPMELRVVEAAPEDVGPFLNEEVERGFDLEHGPVVRALLAHRTTGDQLLVLLIHHIVTDGWSSAILDRELREVITALQAGRRPALAPLEVQYADFAVWQREHLTDEVAGRQLDHWRAVLAGTTPLALPTDRPRPPLRDPRGAMVTFTVPAALTDQLTRLGQRHDVTPYATLLTAWATLLACHSGQWDVAVGTPVAGRGRPEIEGVVGFFLNSLVLRCRLEGTLTFDQALDAVGEICRDAFAHQDLPFENLVAGLAPERDLSRTPLYQVVFDLHDETLTESASNATDLHTLADVSGVAKTDLSLYLRRRPDGTMDGALEYAVALFDRATVERLADRLLLLLESAAAAPQTPLKELYVRPADEAPQPQPQVAAVPTFHDEEVVAPRGIVEERIAEIFEELLEEPAGAYSHFFRSGGNSLLALRLIAAVQAAFQVDLPIRSVFEGPTVAELAQAVEELVRAEIEGLSDAELLSLEEQER